MRTSENRQYLYSCKQQQKKLNRNLCEDLQIDKSLFMRTRTNR